MLFPFRFSAVRVLLRAALGSDEAENQLAKKQGLLPQMLLQKQPPADLYGGIPCSFFLFNSFPGRMRRSIVYSRRTHRTRRTDE
jgi:hypothetical protein